MFKKLKISKRQKFVVTAVFLAAGLWLIQLQEVSWRYQLIGGLTIFTYLLTAWSLAEGLNGVEWFTVLILPTLFTAGVGLFYFLIPATLWARLSVVILYGLGLYALQLTENIFSVAAIRTIQLFRAAQAVGFLLTIIVAFFLYDTILSLRLDSWFSFLLVSGTSLPLLLQGLWHVNLEEKISRKVIFYSLFLSLISGEIALSLSFWPVTIAVGSLALTTSLYITLGLAQHQLAEKLFRKTVHEYLAVGLVVLATIFLATHWGG